MRHEIAIFCKTCPACQKGKRGARKYGKLPLKDIEIAPWRDIAVDLAGPWKARFANNKTLQFWALTICDPCTNWIEIVPITTKYGDNIATLVDREWFCRYPRPLRCIFDQGSEFTCLKFQELLKSYGITPVPTTVKNSTSNAIAECLHLIMGNMLRCQLATGKTYRDPVKEILAAAAWGILSSYHTVLQHTPGQLVFNQDMILQLQIQADWSLVANRRREAAIANNARENCRRVAHTYRPGDKILIFTDMQGRKLSLHEGPYEVTRYSRSTGTLSIRRHGYVEKINIRRVCPYFGRRSGGD